MPSRLSRFAAPLAVLALASACGSHGGRGGDSRAASADDPATVSVPPSTAGESPSTTAAATVPTTAPMTAPPPTTTEPPAGPEVVETVIGRSTIRFTYPPGLSPTERAALDTYHRFLKAVFAATDPPRPESPELTLIVAPEYLVKLERSLEQDRLTGRYGYGVYNSQPTVAEISVDHIRIVDCSLDMSAIYASDGTVFSPADEEYSETVVVLSVVNGASKVRTWYPTNVKCSL